jgi:hypothetical protein
MKQYHNTILQTAFLSLIIILAFIGLSTTALAAKVSVTPMNPNVGADLSCSSPDITSNAVNYVFKWYKNDNLIKTYPGYAGGGHPLNSAPQSTLPGSKVTSGASITCRIELLSGDYVGSRSVQVRTEDGDEETSQDNIPLQITPPSPIPGTELVCSAKKEITPQFYVFKWMKGNEKTVIDTQPACSTSGCTSANATLDTTGIANEENIYCSIYNFNDLNNPLGTAEVYLSGNSVILDPVGDKTTTENQTLSFTLTSTDPDNDDPHYMMMNAPSGATLNPSTGEFSWTPGFDAVVHPNLSQTYNVTLRVTDGSYYDSEQITINVTDQNQDPRLVSANPLPNAPGDLTINKSTFEDLDVNVTVTDNDSDTLSYEWYIDGVLNSTTTNFTFNASNDPSDIGEFNVTLIVTDIYSGSLQTSWFVNQYNATPAFQNISISRDSAYVQTEDITGLATYDLTSYTFFENETTTLDFNAIDKDNATLTDYQTTIASILPTANYSLAFDLTQGIINVTPQFNATNDSITKSYTFTTNVTDDNGLTDTIDTTIYVENTNRAPFFNGTINNVTLRENTYNDTINLSINSTDPDDEDTLSWSYQWVGANNGSTITIDNTTGIVNFTPGTDFVGNVTAEFITWDGQPSRTDRLNGTSNPVTFEVIDAPNQIVLTQNISNQSLYEDNTTLTPYHLNMSEYFSTSDESWPISYNYSSNDTSLWVNFTSVSGDAFAVFNTTPDWYGSALVNISANNSLYQNISNTFTVNVSNVNDAPTFNGTGWTNITIDENGNYTINLSDWFNDIDDDNTTLTYDMQLNDTTNFSYNVSGSNITITPAADWNGTGLANFTANDGEFTANSYDNLSYSILLNVTFIDEPASVTIKLNDTVISDNFSVAEGDLFNLSALITDPDQGQFFQSIIWNIYTALDTLIKQFTYTFGGVESLDYNETNITVSNFSSNYSSAGNYYVNLSLNYTNGTMYNYTYNFTVNETYYDPVWNNSGLPDTIYVTEDSYNDTLNISDYVSSIDSAINFSTFNVHNVSGNLTDLNATFDNVTKILNISPKQDVYGLFTVQFNISEVDTNSSYSKPINVSVTPVDDAPVILSTIANTTIVEGNTHSIDLTTIFEDVDSTLSYTFNNETDASNVTTTISSDTLNITAANVPELKGTYTLDYNVSATDGTSTVTTNTSHLNITYIDDVPVVGTNAAFLGNISVKNDSTYNGTDRIDLRDYISDVDNSSLQYGFVVNDDNTNLTVTLDSSYLLNITADPSFIDQQTENITVWGYDGNATTGHNVSFNMTINADVDPFITIGPNFANVSSTEIGFNVTASEPVTYRLNLSDGTDITNATFSQFHETLISGLIAGTTYDYTLNITDVDSNSNVTSGNFTTRPNDLGAIYVNVNDTIGNTLYGASIDINGSNAGSTNETGELNISSYLEDEGYNLTVSKNGFSDNWTTIDVNYSQTTFVNITLSADVGGSLTGTVYNSSDFSGIENATIILTDDAATTSIQYVTTDNNGDYTFIGVPSGYYDIYYETTANTIENDVFVGNSAVTASDYLV